MRRSRARQPSRKPKARAMREQPEAQAHTGHGDWSAESENSEPLCAAVPEAAGAGAASGEVTGPAGARFAGVCARGGVPVPAPEAVPVLAPGTVLPPGTVPELAVFPD